MGNTNNIYHYVSSSTLQKRVEGSLKTERGGFRHTIYYRCFVFVVDSGESWLGNKETRTENVCTKRRVDYGGTKKGAVQKGEGSSFALTEMSGVTFIVGTVGDSANIKWKMEFAPNLQYLPRKPLCVSNYKCYGPRLGGNSVIQRRASSGIHPSSLRLSSEAQFERFESQFRLVVASLNWQFFRSPPETGSTDSGIEAVVEWYTSIFSSCLLPFWGSVLSPSLSVLRLSFGCFLFWADFTEAFEAFPWMTVVL